MEKRIGLGFTSSLTALCLGVAFCLPPRVYAGGTVANATEGELRAALAGGGNINFACDGTITLSNQLLISLNTVIDASGHNVTLSGGDLVRVFYLNSGVSLTLYNLTVADGRADTGAGIYNQGGTVTISNCTFLNNMALGTNAASMTRADGPSAKGGAICNQFGHLTLLGSTFATNTAQGGNGADGSFDDHNFYGGSGGSARGGSIASAGTMCMTNCWFVGSRACAGSGGSAFAGGAGGKARGGAILIESGSLSCSNCAFISNQLQSGWPGYRDGGGGFGDSYGGGICSTGTVQLVALRFLSNSVNSAGYGYGGAIAHLNGTMTLSGSALCGNIACGGREWLRFSAPGVPGCGGAVFNAGQAVLSNNLVLSNTASGGEGSAAGQQGYANGGEGRGGALFNCGILDVANCTLAYNRAVGGPGILGAPACNWSPGGHGYGGGLYLTTGQVSIVNSTLYGNLAMGGPGGITICGDNYPCAGGNGIGGCIFSGASAPLRVTNCTVVANSAVGGAGAVLTNSLGEVLRATAGGAANGGLVLTNSAFLQNTIVAQNSPGDVVGSFGDHNLIGVDPRLSTLADNGGPTLTAALFPDSPALDAGVSVPGLNADQRGVARPFGSAPDIGAFEWNGTNFYPYFRFGGVVLVNGQKHLVGVGPPNLVFRLQTSTDLASWFESSTNVTTALGFFDTAETSTTAPVRFYRTISP